MSILRRILSHGSTGKLACETRAATILQLAPCVDVIVQPALEASAAAGSCAASRGVP
jgi:hypothetical protein